jgi:hypothetical protein
VAPDGTTVIDEFAPGYPVQFQDFSYGHQQLGNTSNETIFPEFTTATALVPANGSLGTNWHAAGFNDSSWSSGNTGVGYDYGSLDNIDVGSQMAGTNTSVYVRIPFSVTDATEFAALTLQMKYDDGFVAYLNGIEIARDRFTGTPAWDSNANADHPDSQAMQFVDFDASAFIGSLNEGANMLAIHGLNRNLGSSDMLILPQLIGTRLTDPSLGDKGYLLIPTPGSANGLELGLPSSEVTFSQPSQTFFSTFSLTLSGAASGQTIRYTTNNAAVTASSTAYSGPISITGTTQVRAKVFGAGGASGPTSTETYIYLNSDIRTFRSNLPIVILDNFGSGRPNSTTQMFMAIIPTDDAGDGLAEMTDPFQVATRGTMKVRGSSSSGWPKYSMSIEAWDGDGLDQNISPLGFSSESDWVLNSKYQFDRALMRNDLAYAISNDLGEYAVGTRHVEVVNNVGGGNLSYSGDYFGVYSFMEKIKRDNNRVDVNKLLPTDNTEPQVTGGYLFKEDRRDPGDSGFTVGGAGTLAHVYPKEEDITAQQRSWLVNHLNEFNAAVSASNKTHPTNGKHFTEYIKVGSWLKHHWVNTLTMNVDGFRLSGYYYKDRGSKVGAGPVWDFDRTMESTDGRDNNPQQWDGTGDSSQTFYDSRYPWWGEALEDADFYQRWVDLWQTERDGGALSWTNIEGTINEFNTILNTNVSNSGIIADTAQQRNFNEWTSVPPRNGNGHAGEITILKNWLNTRGTWIDGQFTARPSFTIAPGSVTAGTNVGFTGGGGTIYYTTDGSDPRAAGGSIAAGASSSAPVIVGSSMQITARARSGSDWSGPIQGSYLVGTLANASNLAITEVHYAPAVPTLPSETSVSALATDYEFIEVQNVSTTDTISLLDVHFEQGIDFTFTGGAVLSLAPGERALIVANQAAFEARYGTGMSSSIAGEFATSTRLDNDGETVQLVDALGIDIALFTYNDQFPWPLDAGFAGYSLTYIEGSNDPADPTNWRTSGDLDGTPDTSDSDAFTGSATADIDGDGLEAFLEYALGTGDNDGTSGVDAFEVQFSQLDITGTANTYLTVSIQRDLSADEAVLFPETAADPDGPWIANMILFSESHNGDGTSTLLFRSGNPVSPADIRQFCRVTAESR